MVSLFLFYWAIESYVFIVGDAQSFLEDSSMFYAAAEAPTACLYSGAE